MKGNMEQPSRLYSCCPSPKEGSGQQHKNLSMLHKIWSSSAPTVQETEPVCPHITSSANLPMSNSM